jgi:hypothetical protein
MMKSTQSTEEQATFDSKEIVKGAGVPDSARRHKVSENMIYRCQAKLGAMVHAGSIKM